jgi:alcohol dehydrogenase (cytochrome c)
MAFILIFSSLLVLHYDSAFAKFFREPQQEGPGAQQQRGPPQQQQQSQVTNTTINIPAGAFEVNAASFYEPKLATVQNGSNVTWINQDSQPHTATAGAPSSPSGQFDTGLILVGQSGTVTVRGEGTIPYHCAIHPWMLAELNVVSSSVAGSMQQQQQQGQPQQNTTTGTTTTSAIANKTEVEDTRGPYTEQYKAVQESVPEPEITTEFPGKQPQTNTTLPTSQNTSLGTEERHRDNWITANHDIFGTRWSNQTAIGRDNVGQLEVKWIYQNPAPIENPALIVGNRAYGQDNFGTIFALDLHTGIQQWKVDTGVGGLMHGMTYDGGIIYAGTGGNATIVAVNAENGEVMWESPVLGPTGAGYGMPAVPLVWNDYVIAGSAGGDLPAEAGLVQGNITALNRTNGEIMWSLRLTAGEWVSPERVPPNGGATVWSGMSFDPETGIIYAPTGNGSPDFNATSRLTPEYFTNSVVAVNITNGRLLWHTPFVEYGTVLDVALPDTHDFDVAFGTSISKVTFENGTESKIVIGHDKMGNIMALDAQTGNEIWWTTVGTNYRTYAIPKPAPEGSGEVWPGTQGGVEAFHAVHDNTLYVATSSGAFNYFVTGISGELKPLFDKMPNGIGNGTITAIDMTTGEIKWQKGTELPTWVSPLVTNGILFAGHITDFGYPYDVNEFGAAMNTPLQPSGILLALNNQTGETLWEFNVGGPIGIGGPSIGNGLLLVTTGIPAEIASSESGSIIAFGLPNRN